VNRISYKLEDLEEEPNYEQEGYADKKFEPLSDAQQSEKSKHLIKELPFFRIEPFVMIIVGLLMPIMVLVLQAIGVLANGVLIGFLIVLVTMWVMWLVKYFKYLPTGKKVIVARFYKNTGVALSSEKINKEGVVKFDRKGNIPPTQITQVHKHFEMSSGRPMVIAVEEVPQNLSLLKRYKPDRSARELNSVIKVTWNSAWHAATENILGFANKFKDPNFIVGTGALVGVIIVGLLLWQNLGSMTELQEVIMELKSSVDSLAAAM